MLNAELKSMNSILTYKYFLSRCVRAGWRAVVSHLAGWCSDNNLALNVEKKKGDCC